ncbi:hypothetical protein DMC30DRAFT_413383 [Rhodotorula diobovata]|uniref:Uncharacterized protein n=1 Tax=Rhodotorula diobovata TaxID=5288 RepID=A0A5C5G7K0_9BASI|nr:hypothetical protein DMC30DRAFT_413383 [Rhodotorula diobovata]
MRPSPSLLSGSAIPRYRSPALSLRLPPPKLPLFRSVVAHPPAPFAVEAHARAKDAAAAEVTGSHTQGTKAEGKGKAPTKAKANKAAAPATPPSPPRPLVGPHQLLYSTAPRPLIPLTASPTNHKLWNPPAPDSAQTRSIDKDESGRLARFAGRFGGAAPVSSAAADDAGAADKKDDGLFGIESDMSWLEGVTTQSPGTALGKRDVVGPGKKEKGKGKK